jgi:hypothetical protein
MKRAYFSDCLEDRIEQCANWLHKGFPRK